MRLPNSSISYPQWSLLRSWPVKSLTDCGIATRHALYGTWFEIQGDEIFRPVRSQGQTSLLYDGHRVFPGDKATWT